MCPSGAFPMPTLDSGIPEQLNLGAAEENEMKISSTSRMKSIVSFIKPIKRD